MAKGPREIGAVAGERVLALATPIVVIVVWLALRRMKHRLGVADGD